MADDPAEWLSVLVGLSGVTPGADDQDALLHAFEKARAQSELLFAVEAARFEEPTLVFSATTDGKRA